MQRADVRMRQLRDRARLAVEALAQLRVGGEHIGQDLDGDDAIEPRVAGAIDFAHAAGAERCEDLVGSEACAERQAHSAASRAPAISSAAVNARSSSRRLDGGRLPTNLVRTDFGRLTSSSQWM